MSRPPVSSQSRRCPKAAKAQAANLFVSPIYSSGGVRTDTYPTGHGAKPAALLGHQGGAARAHAGPCGALGARRIRVNCLALGGVAAGQDRVVVRAYEREAQLGWMATPGEIAALAVATLCSPAASYVTGPVVAADGGWSAW